MCRRRCRRCRANRSKNIRRNPSGTAFPAAAPFPAAAAQGSHFPNLFRFTLGSYLAAALPRSFRPRSSSSFRPPSRVPFYSFTRSIRRRRRHPYKPAPGPGKRTGGNTVPFPVYLTSNLRAFAENVRCEPFASRRRPRKFSRVDSARSV